MFTWFKSKKNKLLGIDLNNFSFSVVAIKHEDRSLYLEKYAYSLLQTNMNANTNDPKNIEVQAGYLKKLLKKQNFTTNLATIAVPTSSIISGTVTVDAAFSSKEIETQVLFDAEKIIPYPLEDVALDFTVHGPNTFNKEDLDVTLVACRKQLVDEKEELLTLSGLQPYAVDVVSFAMERAYRKNLQPSTQKFRIEGLIHIGDESITLNILKNGVSIHVGTTHSDIKSFIHTLEQKENLPLGKVIHNLRDPAYIKQNQSLLDDFDQQLVQYINRLLEQYYSSHHEIQIEKLMVCGHVHLTGNNLLKKIEVVTNLPCDLANAFKNMNISTQINKKELNKLGAELYIACGLAMRDIQ